VKYALPGTTQDSVQSISRFTKKGPPASCRKGLEAGGADEPEG
jgi:hypothetical protein